MNEYTNISNTCQQNSNNRKPSRNIKNLQQCCIKKDDVVELILGSLRPLQKPKKSKGPTKNLKQTLLLFFKNTKLC